MLLDTVETVVGPFSYLSDDEGAVYASGWNVSREALLERIDPALRPADDEIVEGQGKARAAVVAWSEGDLEAPLSVPVKTTRDGFLPQVWDVLRTVPAGRAVTYAELAARAGRPSAARAAGQACARNPVALFVPCHRVVRADGEVGGFAFGPILKESILQHEGARTIETPGGLAEPVPDDDDETPSVPSTAEVMAILEDD